METTTRIRFEHASWCEASGCPWNRDGDLDGIQDDALGHLSHCAGPIAVMSMGEIDGSDQTLLFTVTIRGRSDATASHANPDGWMTHDVDGSAMIVGNPGKRWAIEDLHRILDHLLPPAAA